MAIRVAAGSAWSLTRIKRISRLDAIGLLDAVANILSVNIVLLLGVARWRPPRRSLVSNLWACGCELLHLGSRTNPPPPPARWPSLGPHIFPNPTDGLLMNCYLIAIHLLLYCYSNATLVIGAALNLRFMSP
jgi:hypothetical protein